MPRFATRCDSRADASASEPGAPLGGTVDPDAGLPVPFSRHGQRRSYRGFLDDETAAALRQSRESGAALNAVAPIGSSAGNGAHRGLFLAFLGFATLAYLANRGA